MRLPIAMAASTLLLACGVGAPDAVPTGPPASGAAAQAATRPTPPAIPPATAPPAATAPAAAPAAAPAILADANRAFAVDLYGRLRAGEGNLAFSPASISLAMAMTWAGARGETAAQMARALRFEGIDPASIHSGFGSLLRAWNDPGNTAYTLRVANRLFGERRAEFLAPFLAVTRDGYGAPLEPVDFQGAPEASRERINAWVAERTADRIRGLLPPGSVDTDTRLALANAVYFKGKWRREFDQARTAPLPFQRAGGGPVAVPTMHQEGEFGHAALDGVQVLRLPYVGEGMAMYVILPDAADGLPAVEFGLTAEALKRWTSAVHEREVRVWLPRFTIDPAAPVMLKQTLAALGMPAAFERQADFTGMAAEKPLYISNVFHKAFVEVNEEGTEAAAATAVIVTRESERVGDPPEFRADHPFLFLIHDRERDAILFLGRVVDPAS